MLGRTPGGEGRGGEGRGGERRGGEGRVAAVEAVQTTINNRCKHSSTRTGDYHPQSHWLIGNGYNPTCLPCTVWHADLKSVAEVLGHISLILQQGLQTSSQRLDEEGREKREREGGGRRKERQGGRRGREEEGEERREKREREEGGRRKERQGGRRGREEEGEETREKREGGNREKEGG